MANSGPESLIPFVTAAYTMWGTPGPNNMMLAHSGVRFGLRRTAPQIFGVVVGTVILTSAGFLVLEPIVARWPQSLFILKLVGTFWLIWIGLRMARAARNYKVAEKEQPMSFISAALFQFANPKAITATIALASLVFTATNNDRGLLVLALLSMPFICLLANGPWALAGLSIRRFLATPKRWAIFTMATGALCAGSAVFLWI